MAGLWLQARAWDSMTTASLVSNWLCQENAYNRMMLTPVCAIRFCCPLWLCVFRVPVGGVLPVVMNWC